ncbi:MAG: Peptidyl-tRNA hydrolase [Candidatus Amesbacteria bacterium GW2011_GWB1_47_19]|nr:MAG: Peptidyl-tRNA hydrolase [Candidatus Amesbacteria bacterium GW2011_GWA1_44_24]KKU31892.1 MAG: peptidyl-tRNA hydrolase, peptidyl-tRNA hydrolase, PTH1 family [Candidatus Amesbacteria bacterium GW2011_GWC1_46_24]KKU66828.1 MAG: Peptidyl-tRNA hydrolase [Candidatus Amesbacteria bacterium GW2011_GWB1_47_19]OGD05270.1 MAG: hypothetical protein A2379_03660 [Candidatus Amesbacteria bacterium RIFOXYB1_FULL_47_13]HBC73190.1 hypothetical protein [Candidatus Amesbacteria bacterium]
MVKIILGLGNPGVEYAGTRHNCGVLLVDRIFNLLFRGQGSRASRSIFNDGYGWRRTKDIFLAEFPDLVLVKTAGLFMNESGKMIHDLKFKNYDFGNLFVAHDDLDIKLGEYKIQKGVGPKEHNGVLSVEQALGTKEFWRVRIGIENRQLAVDGETYVLQRFSPEEKEIIESMIEKAARELTAGL